MAISPVSGYGQAYNPYENFTTGQVTAQEKADSLKPKSQQCET